MGAKAKLADRFGGNIRESMGARGAGGFTLPVGAIPAESLKYQGCTRVKSALLIETNRLVPDPNQPRKDFDEDGLNRLADSLKARGQLQPIRVRWDSVAEHWTIIAGERRWRAAQLAGITTVTAVEATAPLTEDEILEEQLIENCIREDLKPVEQARAYKALLERGGLSQRQLAQRLAIAQGTIAKALALLDLPEQIQEKVDAGDIAPSVAYEVSKVTDRADQTALVERIQSEGLTQEETAKAVKQSTKGRTTGSSRPSAKARKETERAFRTTVGRVTVANRRGLNAATVRLALLEALAAIDAELEPDDKAAA